MYDATRIIIFIYVEPIRGASLSPFKCFQKDVLRRFPVFAVLLLMSLHFLYIIQYEYIILKKHGFPSWTLCWPELASDGSWYMSFRPARAQWRSKSGEGRSLLSKSSRNRTCHHLSDQSYTCPFGTSTNSASMACDSMISMHPKCLPHNLATAEEFLQASIFLSATWHDPSWSRKLHLEVNPMPQVIKWSTGPWTTTSSVWPYSCYSYRNIRKPEGGGNESQQCQQDSTFFQHEAATKTSQISLFSDSPPPTQGRTKSPFKQQAKAQKHAYRSVLLEPVRR